MPIQGSSFNWLLLQYGKVSKLEKLRAEALQQIEAAREPGERIGTPFLAFVGPNPMVPLWISSPVLFPILYLLEVRGAPGLFGVLATAGLLGGSYFVGTSLIQEIRWVVPTDRRMIWLAGSKWNYRPGAVVASQPTSELTVIGGRLSWGWSHLGLQLGDGSRIRINVFRLYREGLRALWQALAG